MKKLTAIIASAFIAMSCTALPVFAEPSESSSVQSSIVQNAKENISETKNDNPKTESLSKINYKEYEVSPVNMKISLPDDMYVLTRDIDENAPALKACDITKEDMVKSFKASDIYLRAIKPDFSYDVTVTTVKNADTTTINNLTELDEKELQEVIDNLLEQNVYTGCSKSNFNNTLFLSLELEYDSSNTKIYGIQEYTIINGTKVVITFQSYSGEMTDEQKSIMNTIMKSVTFKDIDPRPQVSIDPGSSLITDIDVRYIYIIILAVIGIAALTSMIVVGMKYKPRALKLDELPEKNKNTDSTKKIKITENEEGTEYDINSSSDNSKKFGAEISQEDESLFEDMFKVQLTDNNIIYEDIKSKEQKINEEKQKKEILDKTNFDNKDCQNVKLNVEKKNNGKIEINNNDIVKFIGADKKALNKENNKEDLNNNNKTTEEVVFARSEPKHHTEIKQIQEEISESDKISKNKPLESKVEPNTEVSEYEKRFGKNKVIDNKPKVIEIPEEESSSKFEELFGKKSPVTFKEEKKPEPTAKTEDKKPEPTAKAEEKKPELTAKAEEKKPELTAKAEEKKPEPTAKVEEKKPELTAKAEEKKSEPTAKAEEKKPEPTAKAEEKKSESTAKVEEKKSEPTAKVEEKKPELTAKAEEKKPEPTAKAEEKKPELTAKAEEKKPEPTAKAEEKKPEPTAKAEEKKLEPTAKVEEKKPELIAKVEEKKPEPTVKAEEKKAELTAKAEEKKPELTAKAEEKKPELTAKAEEKKPELTAKAEEKKPELTAKAEEKKLEPTAKVEEKKPEPTAKAEEKKPEPTAKVEEKKPEPTAKAEEKKAEPTAKAEEKKSEPTVKAEEKKLEPTAKAEEKKLEPTVKAEEKKPEPDKLIEEELSMNSSNKLNINDNVNIDEEPDRKGFFSKIRDKLFEIDDYDDIKDTSEFEYTETEQSEEKGSFWTNIKSKFKNQNIENDEEVTLIDEVQSACDNPIIENPEAVSSNNNVSFEQSSNSESVSTSEKHSPNTKIPTVYPQTPTENNTDISKFEQRFGTKRNTEYSQPLPEKEEYTSKFEQKFGRKNSVNDNINVSVTAPNVPIIPSASTNPKIEITKSVSFEKSEMNYNNTITKDTKPQAEDISGDFFEGVKPIEEKISETTEYISKQNEIPEEEISVVHTDKKQAEATWIPETPPVPEFDFERDTGIVFEHALPPENTITLNKTPFTDIPRLESVQAAVYNKHMEETRKSMSKNSGSNYSSKFGNAQNIQGLQSTQKSTSNKKSDDIIEFYTGYDESADPFANQSQKADFQNSEKKHSGKGKKFMKSISKLFSTEEDQEDDR